MNCLILLPSLSYIHIFYPEHCFQTLSFHRVRQTFHTHIIWSRVPTGSKIKNNCAGKVQQFTAMLSNYCTAVGPTSLTSVSRLSKICETVKRHGSRWAWNQEWLYLQLPAAIYQMDTRLQERNLCHGCQRYLLNSSQLSIRNRNWWFLPASLRTKLKEKTKLRGL